MNKFNPIELFCSLGEKVFDTFFVEVDDTLPKTTIEKVYTSAPRETQQEVSVKPLFDDGLEEIKQEQKSFKEAVDYTKYRPKGFGEHKIENVNRETKGSKFGEVKKLW